MNQEHEKKQKAMKYGGYAFLALACLGFSAYVISDYLNAIREQAKPYTAQATLPLDNIDPKEIWVEQMRTENELVQSKVDFIQNAMVQKLQEEERKEQFAQKELFSLRTELEGLKEQLKQSEEKELFFHEMRRPSVMQVAHDPFVIQPEEEVFVPLSVAACPDAQNLHHVMRAIPAGTTVKAILMSSVDMPCSVQGSADPQPVKLKIIADGRLPHGVRALLKRGIVTASVYGDLSSERVIFRLEKLTQVRKDGHFIETQVAGYVSGEDGKYGLRGCVVDRSAKLIENALLTGFLSGASNFFEAAAVARLSPFSCTVPFDPHCKGGSCPSWGTTAGQLAIAGSSEGIGNALDALTDYFIKRAEQLRPVIQITAGRIVDITFLDHADLGDLHTHERVRGEEE
jgi:conjugal transfer pilus assembly protein TraB